MTHPHLPSSKIGKLIKCQSLPILFTCRPFYPARPQLFTICQLLPSAAHHMRCAGRSATATATAVLASDNQISSDLHREAAQGHHTETALSSARCCCRRCALATLLRASSAAAEPSAAVASSFRKQLLRSPPDANS